MRVRALVCLDKMFGVKAQYDTETNARRSAAYKELLDTQESKLKWDGENQHVEWVNGEVVPMPPISGEHNDVGNFLVRVLGDFIEHRAELVERLLDGPLGVDPLIADDLGDPRDEHRIVEHQQLGVEDRGQLGPARGDAGAEIDQLAPRSFAAFFQPIQFLPEARLGDLIAEHLRALDQDDGPSRDNPRGDSDAAQTPHVSSPKPDATRAASASIASRSSDPSALIVIVLPRPAARSRMPMMLLPSISRRSRATRTCA